MHRAQPGRPRRGIRPRDRRARRGPDARRPDAALWYATCLAGNVDGTRGIFAPAGSSTSRRSTTRGRPVIRFRSSSRAADWAGTSSSAKTTQGPVKHSARNSRKSRHARHRRTRRTLSATSAGRSSSSPTPTRRAHHFSESLLLAAEVRWTRSRRRDPDRSRRPCEPRRAPPRPRSGGPHRACSPTAGHNPTPFELRVEERWLEPLREQSPSRVRARNHARPRRAVELALNGP